MSDTEPPVNDADGLEHGNIYLSMTSTGMPAILISPQMLKAPRTTPGWFMVVMDDERSLLKFAGSCMNKADQITELRERGILPELHEDKDES